LQMSIIPIRSLGTAGTQSVKRSCLERASNAETKELRMDSDQHIATEIHGNVA
jgi:hypothetical protein